MGFFPSEMCLDILGFFGEMVHDFHGVYLLLKW